MRWDNDPEAYPEFRGLGADPVQPPGLLNVTAPSGYPLQRQLQQPPMSYQPQPGQPYMPPTGGSTMGTIADTAYQRWGDYLRSKMGPSVFEKLAGVSREGFQRAAQATTPEELAQSREAYARDPRVASAGTDLTLGFGPGILAGEQAATASVGRLAKAKELQAIGTSADEIWKTTGWYQDADKLWRHEVTDIGAKYTPENVVAAMKAGETPTVKHILEHPDLYKAYPDLGEIKLAGIDHPDAVGAYMPYNPKTGVGEQLALNFGKQQSPGAWRETLLHELQHAVQAREGFVPGGSPKAQPPIPATVQAAENQTKQIGVVVGRMHNMMGVPDLQSWRQVSPTMRAQIWDNAVKSLETEGRSVDLASKWKKGLTELKDPGNLLQGINKELRKLNETVEARRKADLDNYYDYLRIGGENESFNVMARSLKSPEWLAANIPTMTARYTPSQTRASDLRMAAPPGYTQGVGDLRMYPPP